jgi:hypothetical protein
VQPRLFVFASSIFTTLVSLPPETRALTNVGTSRGTVTIQTLFDA